MEYKKISALKTKIKHKLVMMDFQGIGIGDKKKSQKNTILKERIMWELFR